MFEWLDIKLLDMSVLNVQDDKVYTDPGWSDHSVIFWFIDLRMHFNYTFLK